MNNDVITLNKEIDKCKNEIISNYKDLLIDYQNSNQLYHEFLFESKVSASTRQCSQLVGYNYDSVIIIWEIVTLDNVLIYSSSKTKQNDGWILDLSTLSLEPGTQFKFRANLETKPSEYSVDTFVYVPGSNTLYYYYKRGEGTPFSRYYSDKLGSSIELHYLAMIPSPATPPILKCSAISVRNDAMVFTRFELRLATNGDPIYTSGRYKVKETWSKKFSDLHIAAGVQLILHSAVMAGSDSEGYAVLQYDPTSTTTAVFTLGGITANTITMFGKPHYVH